MSAVLPLNASGQGARPTHVPLVDVELLVATAPIGPVQRRVIALCGLLMLFEGLDGQITAYVGPALAREWQLNGAALGQVFSAGLLGMLPGMLAAGAGADRFGRRPMIVLAAVLLGAGTMLTAAAGSMAELLAWRVLAGIGMGATLPNALAITGDYSPVRWRATLVIVMFTGFSLGSILGGGLTGAIMARHGWRPVFLVAGALPLLLAPLLHRGLPPALHGLPRGGQASPDLLALLRRLNPRMTLPEGTALAFGSPRPAFAAPVELFRDGRGPGTVLLWLACFASLMEVHLLQAWLPTILADAGLGAGRAVLATTGFFMGGIIGGLVCGRLMDQAGAAPVLAALFGLGAATIPLVGRDPTALAATMAAIALAGFCAGGGQKGLNALAVMFYPAPIRATGVAAALGAGRFGSILGPLVVGHLRDAGWPASRLFLAAGLPMLAASLAMLALRRQPQRT